MWKKALFALAVSLFFLAAIELVVRLALPPIQVRGPFEKPPEQLVNRDVSIFQSDSLLFWSMRPGVQDGEWDYTLVSTNEIGLRYGPIRSRKALEREMRRPLFRILCVGDSITFGYRTPPGSTFPAVLERTLNAMFPSHYWQVIPLACPGYSSLQSLEHLRARIKTLDPDFLILNSGWNDVQQEVYPDKVVFEESQAVRAMQGWLRHSQLYLHMRQWLLGSRPAQIPAVRQGLSRRVSEDDYCANILAMAALGRRHGASSLALDFFYQSIDRPDNLLRAIPAYRAALAEACAAASLPHLDTPFLTESAWPENRDFFGEAVHPNDRGHYLIARQTLMWMLENNALPLTDAERALAERTFAAYGTLNALDFASETAMWFGPDMLQDSNNITDALCEPPRTGLLRYLFPNHRWQGPLLHVQPVADIHHTFDEWHRDETRPLVPPFSMYWDGWLMIPEWGIWGIGTRSDDGSIIYLDGELWLDNGVRRESVPGERIHTAPLEAGPHRLQVWYFDVGWGAEMSLIWSQREQPPVPIPPESFRAE